MCDVTCLIYLFSLNLLLVWYLSEIGSVYFQFSSFPNFFFYSSSQQNLMLVNLLASQNIPQARKLMLNDGMTKLGGVNDLNPALYYKYLVLYDNILKLCILIKVWLISTCGIISYVKDIIILGFYNYCFG